MKVRKATLKDFKNLESKVEENAKEIMSQEWVIKVLEELSN